MIKPSSLAAGLRRDARGSVASEFALLVPLLFSIVFGALEAASIAFSMSFMQHDANVMARRLAVNTMTEAEAQAELETILPRWLRGNVTLSLEESDPGQPRNNRISVRLVAAAENASPIVIFSRAIPWTIRAESTSQQEVPFDG